MTEEKPDFAYKAVSAEGVNYYLSQGKILLRRFYPKEGLLLLKSVRMLGDMDHDVYSYSAQAAAIITEYKKIQGTRFDEYDREASILLCRKKETTWLHNDYFGYSLKVKGTIDILKTSLIHKERYGRGGVLAGVKLSDKEGYDFLVLINAERFVAAQIKDMDQFREMIAVREGADIYRSETVSRKKDYNANLEITKIERDYKGKTLSGRRLLSIQGGTGVSCILISPQGEALSENMDSVIESFNLSARK
ncbi:MAG: hypothetical protein JXN63_08795 [Candidatus Delongbacteria bacterium]|nr:hypothetical protein [Candidatus Delongbacteria bacterium]